MLQHRQSLRNNIPDRFGYRPPLQFCQTLQYMNMYDFFALPFPRVDPTILEFCRIASWHHYSILVSQWGTILIEIVLQSCMCICHSVTSIGNMGMCRWGIPNPDYLQCHSILFFCFLFLSWLIITIVGLRKPSQHPNVGKVPIIDPETSPTCWTSAFDPAPLQATGPPRRGAGVGVGMLRGDSKIWPKRPAINRK